MVWESQPGGPPHAPVEPARRAARPAVMRAVAGGLLVLVLLGALVGCESAIQPSPSASQVPTPRPLRPLPGELDGIPNPGDTTALVQPQTRRGTVPLGIPQRFALAHCGLFSPIDFDGSLWDPVGGDDGFGGPLTDDQQGELVNATSGTLTLIQPNLAQFVTPLGAVVTLSRHNGGRLYHLCA